MSAEHNNDFLTVREILCDGKETEDDMRFVIDCMRRATFENVYVDDALARRMDENFWDTHMDVVIKEEQLSPRITQKIFSRFVEIGKERRAKSQMHFPDAIDPQTRLAEWANNFLDSAHDEV